MDVSVCLSGRSVRPPFQLFDGRMFSVSLVDRSVCVRPFNYVMAFVGQNDGSFGCIRPIGAYVHVCGVTDGNFISAWLKMSGKSIRCIVQSRNVIDV